MTVTVHGPSYSTYTRSVRLALEEKGVDYRLEEVDILKGAGQAPEHLRRHPFGKVPAFEHDGFALYETVAILRYVDEAFPGPALQPADAKDRARMSQIIAVVDSYGYGPMIQKLFIQRAVVPMMGGSADEAIVAEALPAVRKAAAALDALAADGPWLVGSALSLADLHLAPVIGYLGMTPEGKEALASCGRLGRWWRGIAERPSVKRTQPALG